MTYEIIGKEAIVYFGGPDDPQIKGIVKYMPSSMGDCWIIETDKGLNYIQQFEIIFIKKDQS